MMESRRTVAGASHGDAPVPALNAGPIGRAGPGTGLGPGALFRAAYLLSLAVFAGAIALGFVGHLRNFQSLPWIVLNSHLAAGDRALDTGQYERAMQEYGMAMTIDPGDFNACLRYGIAAASAGKTDEAIVGFHKALEVTPSCADCHHRLGLIYLTEWWRHADPIAEFRAALALTPDDPTILSELGIALAQQGNVAEADASFRRALQIQPTLEAARRNLAMLRERQGRQSGTVPR